MNLVIVKLHPSHVDLNFWIEITVIHSVVYGLMIRLGKNLGEKVSDYKEWGWCSCLIKLALKTTSWKTFRKLWSFAKSNWLSYGQLLCRSLVQPVVAMHQQVLSSLSWPFYSEGNGESLEGYEQVSADINRHVSKRSVWMMHWKDIEMLRAEGGDRCWKSNEEIIAVIQTKDDDGLNKDRKRKWWEVVEFWIHFEDTVNRISQYWSGLELSQQPFSTKEALGNV